MGACRRGDQSKSSGIHNSRNPSHPSWRLISITARTKRRLSIYRNFLEWPAKIKGAALMFDVNWWRWCILRHVNQAFWLVTDHAFCDWLDAIMWDQYCSPIGCMQNCSSRIRGNVRSGSEMLLVLKQWRRRRSDLKKNNNRCSIHESVTLWC